MKDDDRKFTLAGQDGLNLELKLRRVCDYYNRHRCAPAQPGRSRYPRSP